MNRSKAFREITPLSAEDSFMVFERSKTTFDFPLHFHPEFELNFISGAQSAQRIVGDNVEEIDALDLVLVGPNLVHGWFDHQHTFQGVQEITVQFHQDLLDDKLLSRSIFKPIKDLLQRANRGVLFSQETAQLLQPKLKRLPKIDSMDYFLSLVSLLNELANSKDQRVLSGIGAQELPPGQGQQIQKVYEYIQSNFQQRITLAQISSLVNMSQASFNRFIKKRTGQTFVEYVNSTRISYAGRWLVESDKTIGEICFNCGFNNLANFNRVFKKLKGVTPSEYRLQFSGIKRVI